MKKELTFLLNKKKNKAIASTANKAFSTFNNTNPRTMLRTKKRVLETKVEGVKILHKKSTIKAIKNIESNRETSL